MYDVTLQEIESYCESHWNEILSDIESLVQVNSVEDLPAAAPGAPYGPGPREALTRALAIAGRLGLETFDCEGRVGYADARGASDRQVGIIGHVDVVPDGPGWNYDPRKVTRKEGYLIGRGVIDDKGPIMVALHAVRFWNDRARDRGVQLPYTVRVLFGANEETGMADVEYYRAHYDDPAFLFTPDSQFPVGYGESGVYQGYVESGPITEGDIARIGGGQAVNAVPGTAWAEVNADKLRDVQDVPEGIRVIEAPGGDGRLARVEARGVSAHASTPELGVNAIGVLVDFLLEQGVGSADERAFLEFIGGINRNVDGSSLNIACSDEHFGELSVVAGVISLREGRMRQTLDIRYPTAITADEMSRRISDRVHAEAGAGASFTMEIDKEPFLMNPDSAAVRALLDAYCAVTGEEAKGMTSKGATYARHFTTGVSFGVEKPWECDPAWVGGMHGPDEGVREDLLKQAFCVYARAIGNLMQIQLD